jgi:drug/metabolite transporter (DMT)-like permease
LTPTTSTGRGYLAVTGAAVLWGLSGVLAKYLFSAHSLDAFLLVQIRMGSSALLLLLFLALFRPALLRIPRDLVAYLLIFGVVGMAAVQFTYLFTISLTNVATAIFLQYLAPVLTALYARVTGRTPLGSTLLICLGLALGGSALLIFGGGTALMVSPLGLATGLISAFCLSFYTVYGQKGLRRINPWTLLAYGMAAGTLFWVAVDLVLALVGALPPAAQAFAPNMWGFYAYLATLATIVPFGLYLVGLRFIPPTQATITAMLEPVVGGVVAYLLLKEAMAPLQVMGGVLIVAAVILLQWFQQRASANTLSQAD